MPRHAALAGLLALTLLAPGVAAADPWKDESGHGRRWSESRDRDRDRHWDRRDREDRRRAEWRQEHDPWHAGRRLPDGHRPPPGEFRAWYPDRPAGHQPPPPRW